MRLFNRVCRVVVVGQPDGFIGGRPGFFESTGNAVEITALRIQFEVKKNLGKEPNKCTIKISNLAETTRTFLDRKPIRVILHAGYDGVEKLLAVGDMTRCSTRREDRTENVTTIEVSDGMRAYANARMNRSYRKPILARKVLQDAARSLGLELPPEIEQSAELKEALSSGISMHGPTREILTRLLAPYGYGWSIQNGQLLILRTDEVRPGEAHLISRETGLIGSPELKEPEKPGDQSEVRFSTLLFPELNVGQLAKVQSRFVNLACKMTDVSHKGDTRGDDWSTEVTGRPQ